MLDAWQAMVSRHHRELDQTMRWSRGRLVGSGPLSTCLASCKAMDLYPALAKPDQPSNLGRSTETSSSSTRTHAFSPHHLPATHANSGEQSMIRISYSPSTGRDIIPSGHTRESAFLEVVRIPSKDLGVVPAHHGRSTVVRGTDTAGDGEGCRGAHKDSDRGLHRRSFL